MGPPQAEILVRHQPPFSYPSVFPSHGQQLRRCRPSSTRSRLHAPIHTPNGILHSPIPPQPKQLARYPLFNSLGHSGIFSDPAYVGTLSYTTAVAITVTRWSSFRPRPERPEPLSGSVLQQATDKYGVTVAAFAKCGEASGPSRPVLARGECWDVAHETLLHAESLFGPEWVDGTVGTIACARAILSSCVRCI